ncbi:MAG: exosortase family protein XrtF [Flavobacteriaceae bacterium]|nr:exosortase family protein XrtF [Flavobacteriaceae bacterium]
MKEYLIQFKPFLLFLAKFFVTYLVLTFIYQSYLNQFDEKKFEVDGFTQIVAEQSKVVLSVIDSQSYTLPNYKEPSVKLFYHGQWVARIIEGCNALSVIILFISFIIAFTGKFKQTFLFIVLGSLLIHVFNVLRIALLCMAIFHYPHYEHVLHGVIFPLFIYGIVFLLWVIWVNNYSSYAKK